MKHIVSGAGLRTTIPLSAVAPSVAQKAALRIHAPLDAGTVARRPNYGVKRL